MEIVFEKIFKKIKIYKFKMQGEMDLIYKTIEKISYDMNKNQEEILKASKFVVQMLKKQFRPVVICNFEFLINSQYALYSNLKFENVSKEEEKK